MHYNLTYWERFVKPPAEKIPKSKIKVVLLSGSRINGITLDQRMYINLSKQYYAKRHGYKAIFVTSDQFQEFFHPNTFKVVGNDKAKA
jgi:hypothetical protein